MAREPKISVLITSFNREDTLAAAIESVLGNDFGDFEVLVADNCSSDATVEVAQGYARLDARVRVVVNEANLGQFGNRNRAAALARAPFLKYHDSDDVMYPYCLRAMLEPLRATPAAGFALSSGAAWQGGPCPMLLSPRLCYEREFLGIGMFFCGPSGALFRASVFRELGGFADHGAASDYLFWLHACRRVSVLLLPADLFWYRIHPAQELASPAAAASYAWANGEVWRALAAPDCPLAGEDLAQARRNWTWTLARQLRADLRAGRWANARLRLRHCGLGPRDWARYLRRGRRRPQAGAPRDAGGNYLVPRWPHAEATPRPGGATPRAAPSSVADPLVESAR